MFFVGFFVVLSLCLDATIYIYRTTYLQKKNISRNPQDEFEFGQLFLVDFAVLRSHEDIGSSRRWRSVAKTSQVVLLMNWNRPIL